MFTTKLNFKTPQSGWTYGYGGNPKIPKCPYWSGPKVPSTNQETEAQRKATQNKEGTNLLSLVWPPSSSLTFGATEANSPQNGWRCHSFLRSVWFDSPSHCMASLLPLPYYHLSPSSPKELNWSLDLCFQSSYLGPAGSQSPILPPPTLGVVLWRPLPFRFRRNLLCPHSRWEHPNYKLCLSASWASWPKWLHLPFSALQPRHCKHLPDTWKPQKTSSVCRVAAWHPVSCQKETFVVHPFPPCLDHETEVLLMVLC